jgi:hypothetical protein
VNSLLWKIVNPAIGLAMEDREREQEASRSRERIAHVQQIMDRDDELSTSDRFGLVDYVRKNAERVEDRLVNDAYERMAEEGEK